MDAAPPTRTDRLVVAGSAAAGFVLGVLATIPLAHLIRSALGLPEPTAVPLDGPIDRPFTATYWQPWLFAWAILLTPGCALAIAARTRVAGLVYLASVTMTGGVIAFFGGSFDYELG